MHTLIDKEMVDTIRTTGKTSKDLPDREDILREHAMSYDREAKNAIITGCQILSLLPHILGSLTRILDRKNFSYTFLSEEYCCGNYDLPLPIHPLPQLPRTLKPNHPP